MLFDDFDETHSDQKMAKMLHQVRFAANSQLLKSVFNRPRYAPRNQMMPGHSGAYAHVQNMLGGSPRSP